MRKGVWNEFEDQVLRDNFQTLTSKELARLLTNRTLEGIRSRLGTLGLIRTMRFNVKCDYCKTIVSKSRRELEKYDKHFCSNDCKHRYFTERNNPMWNGGTSVQKGYVMKRKSVSDKTRYTREHRIVAARMLGRNLKTNEVVHHKDGNRANNDPSNLEVMTRSEHIKTHWKQGDYDERFRQKRKVTSSNQE